MDSVWIGKRSKVHTGEYLSHVHSLAEYIEQRHVQDINLSYRKEYVDIILEQDRRAQENPLSVDFHKLAAAIWVFLYKNDAVCMELDAQYGRGFSRTLGHLSEFDPEAGTLYLDQTFELPKGDYLVTDPHHLDDSGMTDVEGWLTTFMPSMHIHDTLNGNWHCTLFCMDEGQTFDDMEELELLGAACGAFDAVSGQVCVVSLKEAAAYNKEFVDKLEYDLEDNPMSGNYAAIVRNFKGSFRFEIKETFYKKGHRMVHSGYVLYLVFEGIDGYMEKPIRYESRPMMSLW